MKSKPGDKQRLAHIPDAIKESESYTKAVELSSFLSNSMMRFASIKQIEIIGEAAACISEETKQQFTEVQWKQIIGMRHILVHEYFRIDSKLIWQVIIRDIPERKKIITQIYSSI